MNLDAILNHPALAGMRAVRQWIVYTAVPSEKRPGKLDKKPLHYATGVPTGVNNPASWTDVHTAVATARAWGPSFGVGFCFTPGCGYWFLDLDGCLMPNGKWTKFAMQMVQQAFPGAAVEVSISGKGLHLFGRGAAPEHTNRCAGHPAEFYTADRFVALSGDRLQGNCDTDHTAALAWLVAAHFPPRVAAALGGAAAHAGAGNGPRADWRGPSDDAELIRRALLARSAANAFGGAARASFADLWHADERALAAAFPPDNTHDAFNRSAADAALLAHLAFWTGCDRARMRRLLAASGLAREKHEREDYLERSIDFAVTHQREVLQDRPVESAATAEKALCAMPREAWPENWLALALALPGAEAPTFLHTLVSLGVGNLQGLKAALKDARTSAARERAQAALAARAGTRQRVRYMPESITVQAAEIERLILAAAAPGEYVSFGAELSRVTARPLPHTFGINGADQTAAPDVPCIEPLDKVAVLEHVERVAVLTKTRKDGTEEAMKVPDDLIDVLLGKTVHAAPVVSGLVTHPIVLPDGELLTENGRHASTGLYLTAPTIPGLRPYGRDEAAAALDRLRSTFLDGTEFATPLDRDVAIAGLLTGVQRRVLDMAPGLAVVASTQSSGKTTLARRLHVALTGRDLPVTFFPLGAGADAEVSKLVLTLLRRNPAMICLDNIPDGFTFRSAPLAAVFTSPSFDQRLLGSNRELTVPTSVLWVLTGNNVSLGADEVTRWLTCRVAAGCVRPEERRFTHPDVLAHALSIRAQVLADAVGIVAGYFKAGATYPCEKGTRFAGWDRMVRQPLAWAGGADVAEVFRANAEASDTLGARRAVVLSLRRMFGAKPVTANDTLAGMFTGGEAEAFGTYRCALEELGAAWNAKSIGRHLSALAGSHVEAEGEVITLQCRLDRNGIKRYTVTPA